MSPLVIIVPGPRREHYPLPLVGTDPFGDPSRSTQASHAVLRCGCGAWESLPHAYIECPIDVLLAEFHQHAR